MSSTLLEMRVPSVVTGEPTHDEYIFKEPQTYGELVEMFKVRYDVHKDAGYISENEDGLDLDGYDLCSRFLCVWLNSGGKKRMVASMRVILPGEESPLYNQIRWIADQAKDGKLRGIEKPDYFFPTEDAFELTHVVRDLMSRGDKVVELSRTTKVKDVKDLKLIYALCYGSCALARLCGASYIIGSGEMHMCRLYKMIGGVQILRETAKVHPSIGVAAMALQLNLDDMKPEALEIIRANISDMKTKGFWAAPAPAMQRQEGLVPSSAPKGRPAEALLSSVSSN